MNSNHMLVVAKSTSLSFLLCLLSFSLKKLACMYTGAFIFFFAYRQQLSSLFLVILLLYINAFSLGYFVSAAVNRSMFGLAGTGMSLAWALVLSGTAPHLYKVMTSGGYATVRWVWDVSAPRWGVEAFYLKEMDSRM